MCGHDLLLGVDDLHVIRQWNLGALLAGHVVVEHNLDLNAEDALSEEHMSDGNVDVVVLGLTRVDHPSVNEFHALGTLASQLAAHDDLAALGARLHDEAEDTIAGSSDGKTADELVSEGLALSDGAQTAVGDL